MAGVKRYLCAKRYLHTDNAWRHHWETKLILKCVQTNRAIQKIQEAQLSQGDRAMLRVTEYFAKSFKVVQGHWNCMVPFESLGTVSYSPSIVTMDLILYHFRDKARYWSKIATFSYHPTFDTPVRRSASEYCHAVFLVCKKLEWCGYPTVKMFEDMFSRFDAIPACDGQADRHLATA